MKNLLRVVAVLVSVVPCLPGIAPAAEGNPLAPQSGTDVEKTVAAKVNGVEISKAAVATMMSNIGPRGDAPGSPKRVEEKRKEALDQLILMELAYQKAKSEGLGANPAEIDAALAAMQRKMGSEEKWKEFLEKERITENEMRSRIERNLSLQRILRREIRDKASVSEEEIRREYENDKGRYFRAEKTVVVDVVFFLDPGDAESRKKAEEVLEVIRDDPEKNPWNVASDGTFAVMEVEVREDREKELYEAAKNLKVGELSGVFASEGNLHVIRLKEYTPPRQFTFEEVKGRMEAEARARARQKRLEEWGAELRKGAKIEVME